MARYNNGMPRLEIQVPKIKLLRHRVLHRKAGPPTRLHCADQVPPDRHPPNIHSHANTGRGDKPLAPTLAPQNPSHSVPQAQAFAQLSGIFSLQIPESAQSFGASDYQAHFPAALRNTVPQLLVLQECLQGSRGVADLAHGFSARFQDGGLAHQKEVGGRVWR